MLVRSHIFIFMVLIVVLIVVAIVVMQFPGHMCRWAPHKELRMRMRIVSLSIALK